MSRSLPRMMLTIVLALALFGCGGGDPIARLLSHQGKALDLIEANAADPAAAAAALDGYAKEYGAELAQLKVDGAALVKDEPEVAQSAMIEHADAMKKVTERYAKLMADHPELTKSERFTKAYEALFN